MRVILQLQETHRVTLLRRNAFRRRDETPDAHELTLLLLAFQDVANGYEILDLLFVTVERMSCDEEPRVLLLPREPLYSIYLRNIGQGNLFRLLHRRFTEKTDLSARLICTFLHRHVDDPLQDRQKLRPARTERIECTAFNETLQHALVRRAHVNARAEIQQRRECSALFTHCCKALDRRFTDVSHGGKTEANGRTIDAESRLARVDIGRQNLDAHAAAKLDVDADLVIRVHDAREHRCHELLRIMRLEVRRLPRHKRIRRAVRLVEAIVGEVRQKIEDLLCQRRIDAIFLRALHVGLTLRHQDFMLLLPHGAAQDIRLSEREVREHLHDLHDLLLIENDAESLLQDRFQQRMQVRHLLLSMSACDEICHHAAAQRSWTIERDRRDEVLKAFRLQILDEVRHTRRFHLEYGSRITTAEHFGRLLIFERNLVDIDRHSAALLDMLQSIGNDRERAKTEEIHLQKPQLFHMILVVLRHKRAV